MYKRQVFGCVFLLGMVAAAVFLFITYGMRESHMEHFEKECFETEYGAVSYTHLFRAVMNVIQNAVEHTKENGIIYIAAKEQDDRLTFIDIS